MKYIVKLELKNNEWKSDYRRTVISFFKTAISQYLEGEFYKELYENGAYKKHLVWSIRFSKPQFVQEKMIVSDPNVELTMKISDPQTASIYYSALLEMKGKYFNIGMENQWVLKSIKMVKEPDVVENVVAFKVLSPICIRRHKKGENDYYITREDADFKKEINAKLKEELPYLTEQIDLLEYDFSQLKKVVVPAFSIYIPASIGVLWMKGDKRILNHILKNGLGSRRNAGFGLVEKY